MHFFRKHISLLTGFLAGVILMLSCDFSGNGDHNGAGLKDLPEIRERGELVAITSYSPLSYFIYRGEVMGYEYELLQLFGEHIDLPVRIEIARDFGEMMDMLDRGEGDLIAYGLTVTSGRRERLAFSEPFNMTQQVLVQRKPENWRQMMLHNIENELIRNPIELSGKTVYVRRGSAYFDRLINLSEEIGADIDIVEADEGVTTEELIRYVADGEIDYTVADENIAKIKSAYHQDLDVETAVSMPQQTAWAMRHTSPELLDSLNKWLEEARTQSDYYVIYNKYYENRRAFRARYASDFFPVTGGTISPYDEDLKLYADELGWDWRLLAALIYQESQFDPSARSWAGAVGLMQLMPRTAAEFGADNPLDPQENIAAGVRFLQWLQNYWKEQIEDENERRKFVIASYNVGHGHVQDARRLAEAFGDDPGVWHGQVAEHMLNKSNPEYFNREEVRYGYASGLEPVNYVTAILDLFEHYQHLVDLEMAQR